MFSEYEKWSINRVMKANLYFKLFFLCIILSVFSFKSVRAENLNPQAPVDFDFSQVLQEGAKYSFTAGNNGYSGPASIQRKGNHFFIELPVFVFGASLFGLTNADEVMATNRYYKDKVTQDFFKVGVKSFDEHPELKKMVLETLSGVEKRFSHPNFSLKIIPSFVQNEFSYYKLPGDEYKNTGNFPYAYYAQEEMISKIGTNLRINTKKLPIIFCPFVVSSLVSPVGYDLYSEYHVSLIAHEIGHMLKVTEEGFVLDGYYLDGLMTAETQLRVLSEINGRTIHSQMHEADLFSVLYGILSQLKEGRPSVEILKSLEKKKISSVFSHDYVSASGKGWYQMSEKERRQTVLDRLSRN